MRELLAELLPRWLAIALGIRRVSPGRRRPWRSVVVPQLDTGGAWRAAWRQQDPSVDPREPYGSESSSTGSDHGWSNCTMTSGALAIAYQQPRDGSLAPWGGDLRHRQGDLSGGTDLYDLRTAWQAYGETLTIRSGAGWSAVVDAHDQGRAIVIQGSGNVPGSESFDGGHACTVAPESDSGGHWLWGDPLASGWQWVKPSDIRSWAERWQSSIAFAVGEQPPATPPPAQAQPCVPTFVPDIGAELDRAAGYGAAAALDAEVADWTAYLDPRGQILSGVWDSSSWAGAELVELVADCGELVALWARGPVPDPVAAARHALDTPARFDGPAWRALLWT